MTEFGLNVTHKNHILKSCSNTLALSAHYPGTQIERLTRDRQSPILLSYLISPYTTITPRLLPSFSQTRYSFVPTKSIDSYPKNELLCSAHRVLPQQSIFIPVGRESILNFYQVQLAHQTCHEQDYCKTGCGLYGEFSRR